MIRCARCGYADGVQPDPQLNARAKAGEVRCVSWSCRVLGPRELFSKAGRCPLCEQLWQSSRDKDKHRRYRRDRRALARQVIARLLKLSRRLPSRKRRGSVSSATAAPAKRMR